MCFPGGSLVDSGPDVCEAEAVELRGPRAAPLATASS